MGFGMSLWVWESPVLVFFPDPVLVFCVPVSVIVGNYFGGGGGGSRGSAYNFWGRASRQDAYLDAGCDEKGAACDPHPPCCSTSSTSWPRGPTQSPLGLLLSDRGRTRKNVGCSQHFFLAKSCLGDDLSRFRGQTVTKSFQRMKRAPQF